MDDKRLHVRNVRQQREQGQLVDRAECRLAPAHDVECKDGDTAVREVPLVDFMVRVVGQGGMVDLCHLRVLREEVHDLQRILHMTLDTQGQRLKPVDEVERALWCDCRARVAQDECADIDNECDRTERIDEAHAVIARVRVGEVREASRCLPVELSAVYDHAAEARAVSAEELRRRVHNDVRAVLDGAQEVGRGKGVVDDDGYALRVRCLCDRLDVDEVGVRVADGLEKDALRIRANRICKALCPRLRIDEGHVDAPLLHRVSEQVVRAAVDGLLRDDVIARMSEPLERRRDRRRPRGERECRRAALKCCDALFKHILRRVHEPPVDIARIFECKAVGGVLCIVEHVRGRLIDRHRTRIRDGICLLLPDTHLQGFKVLVFLAHGYSPSLFTITYFIGMNYIQKMDFVKRNFISKLNRKTI